MKFLPPALFFQFYLIFCKKKAAAYKTAAFFFLIKWPDFSQDVAFSLSTTS